MNIFAVDQDPHIAAQSLCDRHVVKMTLETAQMLCSAYEQAPYKRTHYNHPCSIWARKSKANYQWLIAHGLSLSAEYTHRFRKTHKSEAVIQWCLANMGKLSFQKDTLTPFEQCMPIIYQRQDPVAAYRDFYNNEKSRFAEWNHNRKAPSWFKGFSMSKIQDAVKVAVEHATKWDEYMKYYSSLEDSLSELEKSIKEIILEETGDEESDIVIYPPAKNDLTVRIRFKNASAALRELSTRNEQEIRQFIRDLKPKEV